MYQKLPGGTLRVVGGGRGLVREQRAGERFELVGKGGLGGGGADGLEEGLGLWCWWPGGGAWKRKAEAAVGAESGAMAGGGAYSSEVLFELVYLPTRHVLPPFRNISRWGV